MTVLYRFITFMVFCILYPYAVFRAARGDELWRGRLGPIEPPPPGCIWMHASSVGEVRVVGYLVDYLRKRSSLPIHVTTMTRTGFETAGKLLGAKVTQSFFPLDSRGVIRRTLDTLKPCAIVIAETEIWPNLILEAARREIPVCLVNGRMSQKAFGRYRHLRGSLSQLLKKYDRFFFKTEDDAQRYRFFGVPEDHCEVAGDMKFDAPLPDRSPENILAIRARCGAELSDFLIVAGSTREGEEQTMFDLWRRLSEDMDNLRLIIAPRHVERAGQLMEQMELAGLEFSVFEKSDNPAGLILVDRVGLLNDLYVAADVAFVGGTLVDIGGHNILEPVWAGTPVLFGPYLDNVREAAAYIQKGNYGCEIADADDFERVIRQIHNRERSFAVKDEEDLTNSATARAGNYILERTDYARTPLEENPAP